jgi:hypothetical protein
MTEGEDPSQPGYPVDLRSPEIARREAAGPYGDFEARAARIVARATGLKTFLQDDNRLPRTPDVRLEAEGLVVAVGEVVTTTHGRRAEQLRAFSRGELDFVSSDLTYTWWVTINPAADRRSLTRSLVPLLAAMEATGEHLDFTGSLDASRGRPRLEQFQVLGIVEAVCDSRPREGPGRVIGQLPGVGGALEVDWAAFRGWLDRFLTSDMANRKARKLAQFPEIPDRHLFVGVTWTAPWAVLRVLQSDVPDLPIEAPTLPVGVSHLWLYEAEFPSRCLAWWPKVGWFDVQTRWVTD